MHYIYPNGDEVSNIDIVYICKKYTGILKGQDEEVDALRFFRIDEIPQNISKPCCKALNKWISKNR